MYPADQTPGTFVSRENLPMFATAAILAGGKSSRMGFDKQLMMEDDRRILESVIQLLRQEFSDILIVTAKPELYAGMGVRLCRDEYQEKGPLAGVHAALHHARSRYVYLLACDMPVVNLSFIRYMKDCLQRSGADICACKRTDRMEPFNTFYSQALLPDITHRLTTGNSSLFRFIYSNQACVIEEEEAARFDKELRMFTNINTRTEYEKYLGTTAPEPEGEGRALVDKLEILRYIGGEYVPMRDLMVHEVELTLEISGKPVRTLYCSPSERRELVVGHLYTQGYIRTLADILSLELDEAAGTAKLRLAPVPTQPQTPLTDTVLFDPKILLANQQRFYDNSTLQKATAGTHCCALCDDSGTYFSCVDISRHNCMDKLAGKALLGGVSLRDKYILTSGRIPMDMIQKVAAISVPMIVSRSTPTIAAVEAARQAGITLLGFSRENRFNIYSAPHRLKGCALTLPERES
ncbi:MAG: formate dehydrogenase accessory sulfurtransferase FdhD [Oscillospiraceae bacterium]|nr:formate dehydrogenase accessory sulfurtransferase FdhD [Oscillospiraceae bacterium]